MKPKLPPEIEKIIKEHPAVVMMGLLLMEALLMNPSKEKSTVPGLGGRRNGPWRGRGSFGHAPFGKQVGHKR